MTLTFEDARQAVQDAMLPAWDGPGTFHIALNGYEDATSYLVVAGAEEWLVGGNPDFAVVGDPVLLVDKSTGAITEHPEVDFRRFDAMTEVSVAA